MFDCIQFLESYGIETFTEGPNTQEGWINIRCPVCDDHSSHGGFNIRGSYYNCWRCGSSSIAWVIHELLGISYERAKEVEQQFDTEVVYEITEKGKKKEEFYIPGIPLQDRHRKYLQDRGFDPDFIEKKYGVLGTLQFGEYAHRIVIPIRYNRVDVSWQARSIVNAVPKYITCPGTRQRVNPKHILYNLDNCHDSRAMIVEGPTDVWRLGDGACSVFGITFTTEQVLLLASKFSTIFILFDGETQAQSQADVLGIQLGDVGVEVEAINVGEGDPADLPDSSVKMIRKELGFGTTEGISRL